MGSDLSCLATDNVIDQYKFAKKEYETAITDYLSVDAASLIRGVVGIDNYELCESLSGYEESALSPTNKNRLKNAVANLVGAIKDIEKLNPKYQPLR